MNTHIHTQKIMILRVDIGVVVLIGVSLRGAMRCNVTVLLDIRADSDREV